MLNGDTLLPIDPNNDFLVFLFELLIAKELGDVLLATKVVVFLKELLFFRRTKIKNRNKKIKNLVKIALR